VLSGSQIGGGALYTLLLTTMFPGAKAVCAEALAARLAAAIIEILKLEVFRVRPPAAPRT
jgi:hypothetical protein